MPDLQTSSTLATELPSLEGLVATEQWNPRTLDLDTVETATLLQRLNDEDQRVALAVQSVIPALVPVVEAVSSVFRQGGRLIYVGAGTSGRLGVLDASECPPTFGVSADQVQAILAGGPEALIKAAEGAEDDGPRGITDLQTLDPSSLDVVVGISASGGAAYVSEALRYARTLPVALTAGITCVAGSPLAQAVEVPLVAEVGPEALAGSTRLKAGTAQKLILNMITTASMVRAGKSYGNLMVDVQPTNEKLVKRATRLVQSLGGVASEEAAETLLMGKAQKQVKVAIVLAKAPADWTYAQAKELLEQHQGLLKTALKSLSS
jgi:N-acetylmuramic acid 6-phosphate etherase